MTRPWSWSHGVNNYTEEVDVMKQRLLRLLAAIAFTAATMTGYTNALPGVEQNSALPGVECEGRCNSWDGAPNTTP